jgi:hypothetical protein
VWADGYASGWVDRQIDCDCSVLVMLAGCHIKMFIIISNINVVIPAVVSHALWYPERHLLL